jgi:capsular polysaccharide biosynthesis protein
MGTNVSTQAVEQEIELDLQELIVAVLKKWWLLLIGAVIGGLLVVGVTTFVMTPRYQSSAVLYVLGQTTSVTTFADIQIGGALAEDFLFIARSRPTIDRTIEIIIQEEGLIYTRAQIRDMLSVSFAGTRMIEITATSADAAEAAFVANAAADAAMRRIEEVTLSDPPTMVERAEPAAVAMSATINIPLGAAGGLLFMMAIVVIRFLLTANIKTEEDVKKYLGLNTLVVIPEGDQ